MNSVNIRNLRSTKGLTAIELLIGISLLGLVFSLAYSIYHFGITTFNRGEQQIALQQEVRMVSRVLSEELRFSYNVDLLSSVPSEYPSNTNFILVKDNKLMQVVSGTEKVLVDSSDFGDLEIEFKPEGTKQIDFTINLRAKNRSFSVDSSVVVMNIDEFPEDILDEGRILKYKVH